MKEKKKLIVRAIILGILLVVLFLMLKSEFDHKKEETNFNQEVGYDTNEEDEEIEIVPDSDKNENTDTIEKTDQIDQTEVTFDELDNDLNITDKSDNSIASPDRNNNINSSGKEDNNSKDKNNNNQSNNSNVEQSPNTKPDDQPIIESPNLENDSIDSETGFGPLI